MIKCILTLLSINFIVVGEFFNSMNVFNAVFFPISKRILHFAWGCLEQLLCTLFLSITFAKSLMKRFIGLLTKSLTTLKSVQLNYTKSRARGKKHTQREICMKKIAQVVTNGNAPRIHWALMQWWQQLIAFKIRK